MIEYKFGTAGWSYPDWNGTVYPKPKPASFNHLHFLANIFDFVEVNMTFYKIPTDKLVQGWVNKTRMFKNFGFWIKAFSKFTHERNLITSEIMEFKNGLNILAKNKKLEGLLFQFPYSFKFSPGNFSYFETLINYFCEFQLAFEFRHRSWNTQNVIEHLILNNCIWVNIDQPVISHSLPLTDNFTHNSTSYLRLHGRNYENWFSDTGRDQRYNYDYNLKELHSISDSMKSLKKKCQKLFISGNNHYKGNAVKNLIELKKILSQ